MPANQPRNAADVKQTGNADYYLKLLAYGQSGVGKTRFVASAALVKAMSPAVIIDTDESSISIDWKVDKIRATDWVAYQAAVEQALSGKYKTVILDGMTSLYHGVLIPEAQRVNARKYPNRDFDPDVPDRNDYQKAHGMFTKQMMLFRDAPVHFMCTALEAYLTDATTGDVVGYGPMVSGKLSTTVAQYFTVVGRLRVNAESEIEFNARPTYQTVYKDRRNLIPDVLTFPDMQGAMTEVYGYYKSALKG